MCGCTKINRKMKGRRKFSLKTAQDNIPLMVGGAVALAANPMIDPILGSNAWISSLAKTGIGLLALTLDSKIANGFGGVMAAFGAGQLINKASSQFLNKEIPGLPSVAGLPWASYTPSVVARNSAYAYSNGTAPANNVV